MTSPSVLFLFVDGIGLGDDAPGDNPFARSRLQGFDTLSAGQDWTRHLSPVAERTRVFHGIDANLGMEGLPQSGTGQAALFTGENAAALAGRHFGPYPPSKTHAAIARSNVFRQLIDAGVPVEACVFANAYPPRFFTFAETRNRWTVTTLCCKTADVRIRTMEDLQTGTALAADLTNAGWASQLHLPISTVDETVAAARLARLSRTHTFTLFEYYLTDKAGHRQDPTYARDILASLDRFIDALLREVADDGVLVLLTSDHGNLEDLTTRSHTRNRVPFAARGPGAARFSEVASITDVVPALMTLQATGSNG